MRSLRYEELLPRELAAAREAAPLVYFPIGSLEYHGFHLPLGFDALHAHAYCLAAALRTGGVVLPPTYWGFRGHEGFPGSLLVSEETVARLAADVYRLLTAQGFRLIVAFSGHWPDVQGRRLQAVASEHMAAHPGVRILVPDIFALHPSDHQPEHAGRIETSAMLHLQPELVAMERLQEPGAMQAISADAVDASADAGRERFALCVDELVRLVQDGLKGLPCRT
jgi:creatinine amidohydrolase